MFLASRIVFSSVLRIKEFFVTFHIVLLRELSIQEAECTYSHDLAFINLINDDPYHHFLNKTYPLLILITFIVEKRIVFTCFYSVLTF